MLAGPRKAGEKAVVLASMTVYRAPKGGDGTLQRLKATAANSELFSSVCSLEGILSFFMGDGETLVHKQVVTDYLSQFKVGVSSPRSRVSWPLHAPTSTPNCRSFTSNPCKPLCVTLVGRVPRRFWTAPRGTTLISAQGRLTLCAGRVRMGGELAEPVPLRIRKGCEAGR